MADTFPFQLRKHGTGILGLIHRGDVNRQNAARMAASLAAAQGMPTEDILDRWGVAAGLSPSDVEAMKGSATRQLETFQRGYQKQQPSTAETVTGQTQPGPVLQEPSFEFPWLKPDFDWSRAFGDRAAPPSPPMAAPPPAVVTPPEPQIGTLPAGTDIGAPPPLGQAATAPTRGRTLYEEITTADPGESARREFWQFGRIPEAGVTLPEARTKDDYALADAFGSARTKDDYVSPEPTAYIPPPAWLEAPGTEPSLYGPQPPRPMPPQPPVPIVKEYTPEPEPEPTPPDVIPEYLRRPETTAAAPAPPDAFVPGGQRVTETIPGKTYEQVVLEDKEFARQAMAGAHQKYQEGRTREADFRLRQVSEGAMRAYAEEVAAGGDPDVVGRKYEARMSLTPEGRAMLESRGKGLERAGKLAAARTEAEQLQFNREMGERLLQSPDPELRAFGESMLILSRGGKEALAALEKVREAAAKAEDSRLKREELKKPIIVDGVAYDAMPDPARPGRHTLEPLPGQPPKAVKDWYDGKDEIELEAISKDETKPPAMRQRAAELAESISKKRLARAEAAGPKPVRETPTSARDVAERMHRVDAMQEIHDVALAHPEWIGRLDATFKSWLESVDKAPPGFSDFRASVDEVSSQLINALAGAALTEAEIERYTKWIPVISMNPRNQQSQQQFMANTRATLKMMRTAEKYETLIASGVPRDQVRERVKAELDQHIARAQKEGGKEGAGVPATKGSSGFWKKKEGQAP